LVAEGCRRAIYRCKSASKTASDVDLFEEIFEELEPGSYFLKFSVEWLFPDNLREGRLVCYSRTPLGVIRVEK